MADPQGRQREVRPPLPKLARKAAPVADKPNNLWGPTGQVGGRLHLHRPIRQQYDQSLTLDRLDVPMFSSFAPDKQFKPKNRDIIEESTRRRRRLAPLPAPCPPNHDRTAVVQCFRVELRRAPLQPPGEGIVKTEGENRALLDKLNRDPFAATKTSKKGLVAVVVADQASAPNPGQSRNSQPNPPPPPPPFTNGTSVDAPWWVGASAKPSFGAPLPLLQRNHVVRSLLPPLGGF